MKMRVRHCAPMRSAQPAQSWWPHGTRTVACFASMQTPHWCSASLAAASLTRMRAKAASACRSVRDGRAVLQRSSPERAPRWPAGCCDQCGRRDGSASEAEAYIAKTEAAAEDAEEPNPQEEAGAKEGQTAAAEQAVVDE